jgi:hypothetical protein
MIRIETCIHQVAIPFLWISDREIRLKKEQKNFFFAKIVKIFALLWLDFFIE